MDYRLVRCFLLVLSLSGCQPGPSYFTPDRPTLPEKVTNASDAAVISLQKKFIRQNIKVVSIGQDYLVSIPSSYLFPNEAPELTQNGYGILNQVACFLKQFRKVAVNVTGYASKYQSARREQALTLKRAREVANYLWSQGIDSRFIFTEGAGSDKPITSYYRGGDLSPNSRIDITFRDTIL